MGSQITVRKINFKIKKGFTSLNPGIDIKFLKDAFVEGIKSVKQKGHSQHATYINSK